VTQQQTLLRSTSVMAAGTVASRATGFLRTVVIAAALGDRTLANAYNVANVLPNIVYELLLGGVLTSVVVPLMVAAAKADPDGQGEAYAQRLLTLVTVVLTITTVAAVAAAPALIAVYGQFDSDSAHDTAVAFARFFLPQILFYGIGATIGAILNTRSRFAAPMWAPVLNNVVVIATVLVFLVQRTPPGVLVSTTQLVILGIGTTAGIVVQTVALLPSLRATGFRLRARLDLRLAEVREAGRLVGWVLGYVAANQVGLLVVVSLAQNASDPNAEHAGGYSPYLYAFTIFSLPHAIVAVSVITALLPRMSRAALDGRLDQLRADLAGGLRLAGTVIVPAALALLLLGPFVTTLVFGHFRLPDSDARAIGFVLSGFALGLVPFSVFQLHLRAFYALGDTRSPALINAAVNAVNIATDLLLYAVLPPQWRIAGLAVGYAVSYVAGVTLTARVLSRRLPPGRDHVVRAYVRLGTAGLLGAAPALGVALAVTSATGSGPLGSGLALAAALPLGLAVYLVVARRLRVPEVSQLLALVAPR
jgi:putative peptidoglycan lipid II flippase